MWERFNCILLLLGARETHNEGRKVKLGQPDRPKY